MFQTGLGLSHRTGANLIQKGALLFSEPKLYLAFLHQKVNNVVLFKPIGQDILVSMNMKYWGCKVKLRRR